jgi:DNA-binding transcriptional ArsR family regulator
MDDTLESNHCARLLRAIGDPDRLKIIQRLRQGETTVGELADELGMTVVRASHHLSVLRNAGLVVDRKIGRHVGYSLESSFLKTTRSDRPVEFLDLGCCRIEIPKPKPPTLMS